MQSKYKTLCNVVTYVKRNSNNPIDELLNMGFTPTQLVYEFGFKKSDVASSDVYKKHFEDLDVETYPDLLIRFSNLDAAIIDEFKVSPEALLYLKSERMYDSMKRAYKFAKNEADKDILKDLLKNFSSIPGNLKCTLRVTNHNCEKVEWHTYKSLLHRLKDMYSLETSVQYIQIAEDNGSFENDEIKIFIEKSTKDDSYALIFKND